MTKISIRFNLQNKKSDKSLILISITWEGQRIQRSAGVSMETKYFDTKKMKVKRNHKDSFEINQYLMNIERNLSSYYLSLKASGEIVTREMIKQKLDELFHPIQEIEKQSKLGFFDEYESFINQRKSNPKFSARRVQRYENIMKHMKNFSTTENEEITFDSFNEEFVDKIILYFLNKVGHVNLTVDGDIRTLKVFLNYCFEKGIIKNQNYKKAFSKSSKAFRLKVESQRIALNHNDIEKIEAYTSKNHKLMKIKDLFLIQIYTGMRYSDLKTLSYENISFSDELIRINQHKTSENITIPINNKLKEILLKYQITDLPRYSNQRYNDYLKVLSKEAGINEKIKQTKMYGKKRKEEVFEKWEKVSSHIARNTFITETLKRNVLPEMVMQVSGHKSRSSFQKYVKIAHNEALDAVRSVWD